MSLKKLKTSTKILLATGVVIGSSALVLSGLAVYSSAYKLGRVYLQTNGKLETSFPENKQVTNAEFVDQFGKTVAKFDLENKDPEVHNIVLNSGERMSHLEFRDWYAERHNRSTPIFSLYVGPMKFINEYFEALSPEEFIDYANWFMQEISWGPDLLSVKSFTLKKGVVINGNSLTLGSHQGTDKETTEIFFYPDSFFGSLPIFSTLAGRGNAPDNLTTKVNNDPYTKNQLEEYIKTIPQKLVLANYDSSKTIDLKTTKVQGMDLLTGSKFYSYDLMKFLPFLKNQNPYNYFTFANSLEEAKENFKTAALLLSFNINNDRTADKKISDPDISKDLVWDESLLVKKTITGVTFEKGNSAATIAFKEENSDKTGTISISSSDIAQSPLGRYTGNLLNAELSAEINSKLDKIVKTGFRDLYNPAVMVNKEIIYYSTKDKEDIKFFKSIAAAADFLEDDYDSSLQKKYTIQSWKVSSNKKVLEIVLLNKKDNTTIKHSFDFSTSKSSEIAEEQFKYFKTAIGWFDNITPRLIATQDIVGKDNSVQAGYIIYTDYYFNLLDEMIKNNPYILKKLNGVHHVKKLDPETQLYKYELEEGEYLGLTNLDRISFIELLKSSSKTFDSTGINYLKYVGAHEYGHHQTLQYAQNVSDPKDVVVPAAFSQSGLNVQSMYNKDILQEYLNARTSGIKVRKASADYIPTPHGIFPNYSFRKDDDSYETVKDIFGADENQSNIDVINNKDRRFIQSLQGLEEAATRRGYKLYDLFILNSFDHESGTINPSLNGKAQYYSQSPNLPSTKFVESAKKDQFFKNRLSDGMGNIIEFNSSGSLKVAEYTVNPKDRTKFTDVKFKIFNKNGKPVIDVTRFKDPQSINELKAASQQFSNSFNKFLINDYTVNGWSDKSLGEPYVLDDFPEYWDMFNTFLSGEFDSALSYLDFQNNPSFDDQLAKGKIIQNTDNLYDKINALNGEYNSKTNIEPSKMSAIMFALINMPRQNGRFVYAMTKKHPDLQNIPEYVMDKFYSLFTSGLSIYELDDLPTRYSPFFKLLKLADGTTYLPNTSFDMTNSVMNKDNPYKGTGFRNAYVKGQFIYKSAFSPLLRNQEENNKLYFGRLGQFYISKSDKNTIHLGSWDQEHFGFGNNNFFVQTNGQTTFTNFEDFVQFASIDPSKFTLENINKKTFRKWDIDYALTKFDLYGYDKFKNAAVYTSVKAPTDLKNKTEVLSAFRSVYGDNAETKLQEVANELMNKFTSSTLYIFLKNIKVTKTDTGSNIDHLFVGGNLGLKGFNTFENINPSSEKIDANKSDYDQYGIPIADETDYTRNKYHLPSDENNIVWDNNKVHNNSLDAKAILDVIYSHLEKWGANTKNLTLQQIQYLIGTKSFFIGFADNLTWASLSEYNVSAKVDFNAKAINGLNSARFESRVQNYFADYVFNFAESLTRDYVQTTYVPSETTTDNIPSYFKGLSENNTGNEYFVDKKFTQKWTHWTKKLERFNKNNMISRAVVQSSIDKNLLKDLYKKIGPIAEKYVKNYSVEYIEAIKNASKKYEENKLALENKYIEYNNLPKAIRTIKMANKPKELEKIQKEYASQVSKIFGSVLSQLEIANNDLKTPLNNYDSFSTNNPINLSNVSYIGKDNRSNNGFFKDRWERKQLGWEIYDDDRQSVQDQTISITDLEGKKVTDRARAVWMYNLKSQGIGQQTVSGIWRDKTNDAITFWGFNKLSDLEKVDRIKISDPETNEVVYLKINKNNTNNLFYYKRQSDKSTKVTLADEGYGSWNTDFTIISGFTNSLVFPNGKKAKEYVVNFVDKDGELVDILTLGKANYLSENGKLYTQAPVYLKKVTTKEGKEQTRLVVQNQFTV